MFTVLAIMKSTGSTNRLVNSFEGKSVEWKTNVKSQEELQEELISSNFDLIVLDQKFYWFEEAEELILRQNIDFVKFKGNFEDTSVDIQKYLNEYIEYEYEEIKEQENIPTHETSSPQIKYIIQEEVREVEKIVYKSRNVRQTLICISTSDSNMIRDYYSCNIGAALGSLKNEKTIIIDTSKDNNVFGYLQISKQRISMVEKGVNPFTIIKSLDYVYENENLQLLRVDSKNVNKKYIKMILFALRDYENIIFVTDNDLEFIAYNYILSIVNEVHLIVEPTIPTVRRALGYMKKVNEVGQVDENIKIILSDISGELEVWENLFEKHTIYNVSRNIYIESINNEQLISNKKEIEIIKSILKLESNKKSFLNMFRR